MYVARTVIISSDYRLCCLTNTLIGLKRLVPVLGIRAFISTLLLLAKVIKGSSSLKCVSAVYLCRRNPPVIANS